MVKDEINSIDDLITRGHNTLEFTVWFPHLIATGLPACMEASWDVGPDAMSRVYPQLLIEKAPPLSVSE